MQPTANQEAQPKKHTLRPALVETKERKSLKRSPHHVENCTETRQSVYARTSYIIAMYIHVYIYTLSCKLSKRSLLLCTCWFFGILNMFSWMWPWSLSSWNKSLHPTGIYRRCLSQLISSPSLGAGRLQWDKHIILCTSRKFEIVDVICVTNLISGAQSFWSWDSQEPCSVDSNPTGAITRYWLSGHIMVSSPKGMNFLRKSAGPATRK